MIEWEAALATFHQEADDLLTQMEDALLSLEDSPGDAELINVIFRAFHTIKGSAGLFDYQQVVDFTHVIETELDKVRDGTRLLDDSMSDALLAAKDHIANLLSHLSESPQQAIPDELLSEGATIHATITQNKQYHLSQTDGHISLTDKHQDKTTRLDKDDHDNYWVVHLSCHPDIFKRGLDPLSTIRALSALGEVVEVLTLSDKVPPLKMLMVESCFLDFEIALKAATTKTDIEDIFSFYLEDSELLIIPPNSEHGLYLDLLDELEGNEAKRLGEILVGIGAITAKELDKALNLQDEQSSPTPLGEILIEQQMAQPQVVETALQKQAQVKSSAQKASTAIRVNSQKLGQLIDLVGELVISQASLRVQIEKHRIPDMEDTLSGVDALVENIRDHAMQLRMVPIAETFNRFKRLVRDSSKSLDKDIELHIEGGDTEIDKEIVEKITDPLTHLIRNSIDHGIELPAQRSHSGKDPRGIIGLKAEHESGRIIIEVSDDGAGLDPERIRQKALNMGLIKEDIEYSHSQILNLIFEPGLTTKQQATNLSGRGVGMDVVKRNIEALRGTIDVDSTPGKGTVFTMNLPLTVAIIEGFMVGVGNDRYVIPLASIDECIEFPGDWRISEDKHYINLRSSVLPYVRLRDLFDIPDSLPVRESLVVLRSGRKRIGLLVDELYGELQTVIKPLGAIFEAIPSLSGATILGDGSVALILNVQAIINRLSEPGSKAQRLGDDNA
jgi:two-component system chemotaxis sensor kinase CheA